jgi:hypothetical protein
MSESEPTLRTASGQPIRINPLLAKIAGDGPSAVRSFTGYVGPSARSDCITVYSSIKDLQRSIEINVADIVHIEEIPETIVPFGAHVVWVKTDAEVAVRRIAAGMPARGVTSRNFVESRVGRLRIRKLDKQVRRECTSNCDCSSTCTSTCDCFSLCDPCGSVCQEQ